MAQTHGGGTSTHSDGVLVISVWKQQASFLGRLTMSDAQGESTTVVVQTPEGVVESVRDWVTKRT